jgi:hypothetical protein
LSVAKLLLSGEINPDNDASETAANGQHMKFLWCASARHALVLGLALSAGGCGTYVPELREFPNYTQADTQNMIDAIVQSMRCELSHAITSVVDNDISESSLRQSKRTYSDFLGNWGTEVLLTFTVVEKTSGAPSVLWTPPSPVSSVFTLSANVSASAQATRIEKLNFFYTVAELYGLPCKGSEIRYDSFLIQNDLKIADLLLGRIGPTTLGTGHMPGSGQKNVLSHEISFQVVTGGSVTPMLKLVRATINPSGPLFGVSRDRTHDLLITFGPIARGGKSLIAIAEQSHFSSQITSGVTTGFRSTVAQ